MLLFRWLVLLLLRGAVVSFSFFIATGQARFKRYGLQILKWTLIAALGFFAVLIFERVGLARACADQPAKTFPAR